MKSEKNNSISKHCDEFHWNVVNDDFDVFILKNIIHLNRSICSLDNIDIETAHRHLCEYRKLKIEFLSYHLIVLIFHLELDRCLNNDKCGQHGSCINTKANFTCECSFFFEGQFCNKSNLNTRNVHLQYVFI